jgi:type II secretory pathway pseudopilin PulG
MVKPLAIAAAIIVALFAAVAVPNLLNAMQRSHQKRSLADLRTIATGWEARAVDMKTYAIGAKGHDPVDEKNVDWKVLTPVSPAALRRALQPTYVKVMPMNDAWGNPFEFAAGDQTYAIRSPGRDGRFDDKRIAAGYEATSSFDADVVYINGSFRRGPEGL